ncbi:hypothetical protein HPB48_008370 [Haemaphysalis longicornis]|uniref:Uncharacterized protein n=1 Tax=Haemaphysalis longicornis TaxID=44386 RepID=A0A9J6FNX6_HAELO|nr:hypothetical protein HPB48_008370 [Haemaphysalis longicornis]
MSPGRDPPRRNGNPTGTLKRLTTEARLRKLPADHFRVIVRPRDRIDVKKMDKMTFMKPTAKATGVSHEQGKHDMLCPNYGQNIYIISDTKDRRTPRPAAYLAAQENTCKGVEREVGLMHTDEDLEKMFVDERNPTILDAKRIKNSKTVVLLFNGTKEDHQCTPTCSLCGGAHATGDKTCKKRFQVHYIVLQRRRQRSWERRHQIDTRDQVFKGETKQTRDRSETPHSHRRRSSQHSPSTSAAAGRRRGRSQSREGHRGEAPHPRKSRSRFKHRRSSMRWRIPGNQGPAAAQEPCRPAARRTGEERPLKDPARENESRDNKTWTDRAADARADKPPMNREEKQVTHAALPEHVTAQIKGIETILQTLMRQIEELKEDNREIRSEIAEMKRKQTEEQRDYSKDRKVARRRINNGETEEKEEESFTEILAAITDDFTKLRKTLRNKGRRFQHFTDINQQ